MHVVVVVELLFDDVVVVVVVKLLFDGDDDVVVVKLLLDDDVVVVEWRLRFINIDVVSCWVDGVVAGVESYLQCPLSARGSTRQCHLTDGRLK